MNCVFPMNSTDFLGLFEHRSVGAVITDPPVTLPPEQVRQTARASSSILRLGGAMVVIGDSITWRRLLPRCGFVWMAELVILWGDRKIKPRNFDSLYSTIGWYARAGARHSFDWEGRSVNSNVLMCQRVPRVERRHPAEKPVGLTNFLISLLTKPGDMVVDPFCGSGSTLVSAELLGRPWAGGDIDERYCEVAERRTSCVEIEEVEPVYFWINGKLKEI